MHIFKFSDIPQFVFDELDYPSTGSCTDLLLISEKECEEYKTAASECFRMVDEATEYVIKNDLLEQIGFPVDNEDAVDILKYQYDNYKKHPHMLGRFDFIGGIEGYPIKLIEFNADTPFTLFESGPLQWALFEAFFGENNSKYNQFNFLHESLVEYFQFLKDNKPDITPVFTCADSPEDKLNLEVLKYGAENIMSGPTVTWENLAIDSYLGIRRFIKDDAIVRDAYNCVIKMVPWDIMIQVDRKMFDALIQTMKVYLEEYNYDIVIGNPLYSLIYQSKALLPIMNQLFPESKYLLNCRMFSSFEEAKSIICVDENVVIKPIFGREGQSILMSKNNEIFSTEGVYGNQKYIAQDLVECPTDDKGNKYQTGVFVSMETPCCLHFRRSKDNIVTWQSEILGHVVGTM